MKRVMFQFFFLKYLPNFLAPPCLFLSQILDIKVDSNQQSFVNMLQPYVSVCGRTFYV